MKKILFVIMTAGAIAACGSNDSGDKASGEKSAQNEAPQDPHVARGEQLVLSAENDCLACHAVADPMTGPAYTAVAERYKSDTTKIDMLAEKIIKGGTGNWGSAVMTPHPQISKEDAADMVRYILSLK